MKRISLLLLISGFIVGCSNIDESLLVDNKENNYAILAPIVKPNNYKTDEFFELYKNLGDYSWGNFSFDEPLSYLGKEADEKYGIGAYRVRISYDDAPLRYHYYLMYENKLFNVDTIGATLDSDAGFKEFLITDLNNDGYKEITISYYYFNPRLSISYLHTLDTKSMNYYRTTGTYNVEISFGFDEKTQKIAMYQKNIKTNDESLYSYVTRYERKFETESNIYHLVSTNYEVDVIFDFLFSEYPLIYKGLGLSFVVFKVKTKMTYTGETFSYSSPSSYIEGARVRFMNGDYRFTEMGYGTDTMMVDWTVHTGDVLERRYEFLDYLEEPNLTGSYDMIVSYRGEEVSLANVLTVID